MMRVKVTQRNIRADADAVIRKKVERVIAETAREIASMAYQLAPKDTGYMADSIAVEQALESGTLRIVVGAYYGKFVEWGTRFQVAQPFLRPAVHQMQRRLRARLGHIERGLAAELGTKARVQSDRIRFI